MIYIHKILPFFFLPLGVTSILIAVGMISRRWIWCLAGLALLWICAMPAVSDQVMRAVEGRAVRMPAAAMPEADVIVVLSSGRILAPGDAGVMEWQDPDRVLGGIALFHAGKAPLLLFPNGKLPWDSDAAAVGPLSMQFAQRMGVPRASMATTEEVVNTAREAQAIAELLKKRKETAFPPKVLLVTSAYHMRRSTLLFEREGLEVIPFPVDFQVEEGNKWTFLDLMPRADALRQTEKVLQGIEIGGADKCVQGIDTLKVDTVTDYLGKEYMVDQITDAHDLHNIKTDAFNFVITIHVLEHLANPVKALLEWNRVVKDGGYIFTAIPKKETTFDRYRDKTPLTHFLEDFYHDISRMDLTHLLEFNQFSVPAIYLDWNHELVPDEETVEQIVRFYRGERQFLESEKIYRLWRKIESEKERHLLQVRNGEPLDIHFHVWESGKDIMDLLDTLMLEPIEIVDGYLGNSILFITRVNKQREGFRQRIEDIKKGVFP